MEKSLDSKTIFMNSFKELLDSKTKSKISVSDLVSHSGLSRQTFYRNFSSIDELVYSIHSQNVSLFYKLINGIGLNQSMYVIYLDLMQKNKKFYQKIISIDDNNSFVRLYFKKTKENMLNYFFRKYKNEILEDKKLMSALDFYVYGLTYTVLTWIKSNTPDTAEYLSEVLYENMPKKLKQLMETK